MKTFSLSALVCAAAASVVSAGDKYIPLDGCAENEGGTLGDRHRNCDAKCCAELCDAHPECNSFSLFGVAKICYLKTRCITPSEPVKVNKYVTWYKSCGDEPLDIADADPRLKSAIAATEQSSVEEILSQIHSYCVQELYTDKYQSKSGALMGSKIVKSNMEDPHSTKCSNADWLRSISKLDWKHDDYTALIQRENPCGAGKMYHILNSGIGSWVSNVANLLYTHSQLPNGPKKTLAFRDQRDRPQERWDLLFSHELPLCPKFEGKSTPFVRPNVIESLKSKNVCDYAATKMFFTQELWNTILRGALKDELNEQIDIHVAAMRKAAVGASGDGADFSGAYIGVHLRHKWEFKLQPPKLADVATLIRASAAQIDPFAHRDVSHADPQCFADEAHRVRETASSSLSPTMAFETPLRVPVWFEALLPQ
eukprot:INCI6199.3.p1 GENE.INCI6199.3~~INCI6199.3.p1  ORF type:complete len:425 (-),score=66.20 INCI6199.3:944-2218(-)